jgi:hypothetical protein
MRPIPILGLAFLLAACGTGEQGESADNAADARRAAVETARLTGLYEGGGEERPNRMCIIDRGVGNAAFGLVVWGANDHSCTGTGGVTREGEVLRLAMTGDESCVIDARIEGDTIILPDALPEGCAYYCGARAAMTGATFEKVADTPEAALRATDLVGDPLCAGAP